MKKYILIVLIFLLAGCKEKISPVEYYALKTENSELKKEIVELTDKLKKYDEILPELNDKILGTWCKSGIYNEIADLGFGKYALRLRTGSSISDIPLTKDGDLLVRDDSAKNNYRIKGGLLLQGNKRQELANTFYPPNKRLSDADNCINDHEIMLGKAREITQKVNYDNLTIPDIRRAVVAHIRGREFVAGKSDEYILAVFDSLYENAK